MERAGLRCLGCQELQVLTWVELVEGLHREGKFRRESSPDRELVAAFLRGVGLVQRQCGCGCSRFDLERGADLGDWEDARRCEGCRGLIDAERLEVLPDTQTCSKCARGTKGARIEGVGYCKRCGGELTWRVDTKRGGYREFCVACGAAG